MRIVRNKGYGQSQAGMIKIIIPLPSQLGRIGKFILHQPSQWKMTRRSLTSYQHSMGRSGNCLSCIQGSCSCTPYATKEDQKGVAQEEQDVINRYYFSRYGRNDLNLIRYGERSCFLDPKPRASLGEVPSPKSTVSLYLFSIKFDKNF